MAPDEYVQGYRPAPYVPTFRTRMDALRYLALHFGRTIHVFEAGWNCLVCGVRFASLEDAQKAACRVDVAA